MDKNQANNAIKTFFAEFEQASNTFDGDLLASYFSDPSMSADPDGRIHIVMAKVHVHMRFEKEPGKPVDVKNDNTYILLVKDDLPRIVFNLTHEDITKIMQKHGLLPAKP